MKVALATPEDKWGKMVTQELVPQGIDLTYMDNILELANVLANGNFTHCLLDLSFKAPNGVDFAVNIKEKIPKLKLILLITEEVKNKLENRWVQILTELGVTDILTHPVKTQEVKVCLDGYVQCVEMSNLFFSAEDETVAMDDKLLGEVGMDECNNGNTAWLNLYHKESPLNYQMVLKKGLFFAEENWQGLLKKQVKKLYFLKDEKENFINIVSEVSARIYGRPFKVNTIVPNFENMAAPLGPFFFKDLPPDTFQAVKLACNNAARFLKMNTEIKRLFTTFQKESSEEEFQHTLLTAHYAAIIALKLDWMGQKTLERIVLGAYLHNIGLLRLPQEIRTKKIEEMTEEEAKLFKRHPFFGLELLAQAVGLEEAVRQIIYQHHEYSDGSGFPNGLTNMKIYPLAKVVALAGFISEELLRTQNSPLEVLKDFIFNRKDILRFDSELVRVLIKAFMKQDGQAKKKK